MQVRRIKGWAPDDTLKHHGIKGQRWGVRRYQNPDGTLTAAGKDRYGSENDIAKDYMTLYDKYKRRPLL